MSYHHGEGSAGRLLTGLLAALTAACAGEMDPATEAGDGDGAVDDPPSDAAVADDAAGGDGTELPAFCADYPPPDFAAAPHSSRVFYGDDGLLTYVADDAGNRITDFGHAGYHEGEREPPEVPEVDRLGPERGDDTARIQRALDAVAEREPDASGIRGALVLDAGTYEISGTLRVRAGGVVLRGVGDGDDPAVDTILRAVGDSPHQRSVIVVGAGGGGDWREPLPDSQVEITTPFVAVGERSFEVDEPTRLAVGERVIVRHPSTAAWIAALGGGGASVAWTPGELDISYLRRIVAIEGARVTLDVPVHNALDRSLAHAVVFAIDDSALVREVGVERLRVDIQTAGGEDEDHAWNAIQVAGAEDAWVRDATALHFGYAGVRVAESNRITVRRVRALDGVGQVTGGRLYHFAADDYAQQILFVDCESAWARHAFVANGTSSVSGIVFLRGRSQHARTSSEGHRRWSQALLYDNIVETAPGSGWVVGLYNRGDWGTQHGWAAAHSVLWRYDTAGKDAIVQRPPTAQNWAIGTIGNVTANGPFPGPPGYVESVAPALAPHSLYEAQLCDRLERRARAGAAH